MSTTRALVSACSRFPESDGVPLESPWHRDEITLLVHLIWHWLRDRHDFYAGGNMFIYWDRTSPSKSAGPDFFFVRGVDRDRPRRIWAVWDEENRFPDTIIELMSPTTKHKDRRTNKALYEQTFRTTEYFLYDPVSEQLTGWRLHEGVYIPLMPNERGWLWSGELGLWLGTWAGEITSAVSGLWLRFYDPQGHLVLTPAETQWQEKESERQRADVERQRAEAAEAELARLRQLRTNNPARGGRPDPESSQ